MKIADAYILSKVQMTLAPGTVSPVRNSDMKVSGSALGVVILR